MTFGLLWAPFGNLILGKMIVFWRLFFGFFFKSGFGDVGRCRASEEPAAVVRRMGGGIPLDIPGEGIERKFHTPAAGLRPGAADLYAFGALPPAPKYGNMGPIAP